MEKIRIDSHTIKTSAPHAWEEFIKYYQEVIKDYACLSAAAAEDIPLELQLGLFMRFFHDNGIELDVGNIDFELLPETIREAFETHERIISHYS